MWRKEGESPVAIEIRVDVELEFYLVDWQVW